MSVAIVPVDQETKGVTTSSLRVAIEAQILPGEEGGLEAYLQALVGGLGEVSGPDWAFTVVRHPQSAGVFDGVHGSVREVFRPETVTSAERLKRWLGPVRSVVGRAWRRSLRSVGQETQEREQPAEVESDGFWESLGVDVVHFPYIAHRERTAVTTVLTVHDLQHRHFPQFFNASHLRWRENAYPLAMRRATLVIADSDFVRDDIIAQYGVAPDKVVTAHAASVLSLISKNGCAAPDDLAARLDLPAQFALYPALTYSHKNHVRLIDAVALLRDRGQRVTVICPGRQKHHWPAIRAHVEARGVGDQVRFPGYISPSDLLGLFRMAKCLVFPSLFEGAGLPVIEAMEQGLAVACSRIPSLVEYAGDAASFFNPEDVESIAEALGRLVEDDLKRAELRERGLRQARKFTMARMAERHQQIYRLASNRGPASEA